MKILLLVSAFNGLTQRAWCSLRKAGHEVSVELALTPRSIIEGVEAARPDVVLCPFLKDRVPAEVWRRWRTVIIHPGPVGDRGPSSLDHAILDSAPRWGVTALQAVEEMDAGPIWASRTFAMPAEPPRKSALYNGPVADAAMECIVEVVQKAADPLFVPTPLEHADRPIPGTGLRPLLRQVDRAFSWAEPAEDIVRKIRAADGAPGVLTELNGVAVHAYDAHLGQLAGPPGTILGHRDGAVLVGTGPASVWLGQLRTPGGIKLAATTVLRDQLRDVPQAPVGPPRWLVYHREGPVGSLSFHGYNGALSTRQCRELATALRVALAQDTRVLVLRGADDVFCNGIHLGTIEAAPDAATEAWANIRAINSICQQICSRNTQHIVAAFSGNAGAGGVMMALGADAVVARGGVVLNPYYDIGLYGSELHTYSLPARVGAATAARLLADCLPVDNAQAAELGLVDAVGPADPVQFAGWLGEYAVSRIGSRRRQQVDTARPLSYFETTELAEMGRDMFEDRSGFTEKRKAFVYKKKPTATPARLTLHR